MMKNEENGLSTPIVELESFLAHGRVTFNVINLLSIVLWILRTFGFTQSNGFKLLNSMTLITVENTCSEERGDVTIFGIYQHSLVFITVKRNSWKSRQALGMGDCSKLDSMHPRHHFRRSWTWLKLEKLYHASWFMRNVCLTRQGIDKKVKYVDMFKVVKFCCV